MRLALAVLISATLGCAQEIIAYPDASIDAGAGADSGSDGGIRADSGGPPDGGADAGTLLDAGLLDAETPDSGAAACIVDPFVLCEDSHESVRTNDSWTSASSYSGSAGCIQADDLTVLDGSVLGVMCPAEPADYHALTIVPCDTRTLRLEIRLHMLTACDPDKYELEVRAMGGVRACGEEINGNMLRCSEDGQDRIVQLLIPPDRNIQPWYIGVRSDSPDVQFDYDLQVTVQ
jgi:hypothetical protein